ncbi:MAG: hypothetical protein ABIQ97_06625 [Lysobacteraceae bacterium]
MLTHAGYAPQQLPTFFTAQSALVLQLRLTSSGAAWLLATCRPAAGGAGSSMMVEVCDGVTAGSEMVVLAGPGAIALGAGEVADVEFEVGAFAGGGAHDAPIKASSSGSANKCAFIDESFVES